MATLHSPPSTLSDESSLTRGIASDDTSLQQARETVRSRNGSGPSGPKDGQSGSDTIEHVLSETDTASSEAGPASNAANPASDMKTESAKPADKSGLSSRKTDSAANKLEPASGETANKNEPASNDSESASDKSEPNYPKTEPALPKRSKAEKRIDRRLKKLGDGVSDAKKAAIKTKWMARQEAEKAEADKAREAMAVAAERSERYRLHRAIAKRMWEEVKWKRVYGQKFAHHVAMVQALQRFFRNVRWRRRRVVRVAAAKIQRICRGAIARERIIEMQAALLPIDVAAPYLDPVSLCRAERVCLVWRARLQAQDVQDFQWFPWMKKFARLAAGAKMPFLEGRKWKKFFVAVRGIRELLALAYPTAAGATRPRQPRRPLRLKPSVGGFSSGQPFASFVLLPQTAARRVATVVRRQLPPLRFVWAPETQMCFPGQFWFRELLENAHRFPVKEFVAGLLLKDGRGMSPDHVIQGRPLLFWLIEYGCCEAVQLLADVRPEVLKATVAVQEPITKQKRNLNAASRRRRKEGRSQNKLVRLSPRSLSKLKRQQHSKTSASAATTLREDADGSAEEISYTTKHLTPLQYVEKWIQWAQKQRVGLEKGTAVGHEGFAHRHEGLFQLQRFLREIQDGQLTTDESTDLLGAGLLLLNDSPTAATAQAQLVEHRTAQQSGAFASRACERQSISKGKSRSKLVTLNDSTQLLSAAQQRKIIVSDVRSALGDVDAQLAAAHAAAAHNIRIAERQVELIDQAARQKEVHADVSQGMEQAVARIRSGSSLELQRVRQLHFEAKQLLAKVLPEWSALLDSIRDMVAVDAPGERNQWRAKLVQQIRALAAIAAETNDSGARDTSERIKDLLQGYLRNPMMTVAGVKQMLESIENELHGLEIRVNLAYRTRSMRVERLAGLLQNLVQQQTLSTVEIVRKLQQKKLTLESHPTAAVGDENELDLQIFAELEREAMRQDEADSAAEAATSAAIDANLNDLAKVPWVPTLEGETTLRLRFHEVLRDCLRARSCARVLRIYAQMIRQHVRPDRTTFQLMVLVCKHADPPEPELAIELFDEMRRSDFVQTQPSLQMYNQMIEACAECGSWRKALRMFQSLVQDPQKLEPNGSTYKALTKAARRAPVKDAPAIYDAMKLYGVPEYISYNAASRTFLPKHGDSPYHRR